MCVDLKIYVFSFPFVKSYANKILRKLHEKSEHPHRVKLVIIMVMMIIRMLILPGRVIFV